MPLKNKGTKKPNLIVNTKKLKKSQQRLVEGIANANKPNMSHGPDLYMPKAGPFNMKPGNNGSIGAANNTPGSFRADSNAMMFASSMPKYKLPKDTGDDKPSTPINYYNIRGTKIQKMTGIKRNSAAADVIEGNIANLSPSQEKIAKAEWQKIQNAGASYTTQDGKVISSKN
mgnify:CR=1 FL=1|tara:strand:+ start:324 stop:839 length:516 start_codon:yes stop_codon:yes gene_type:complete